MSPGILLVGLNRHAVLLVMMGTIASLCGCRSESSVHQQPLAVGTVSASTSAAPPIAPTPPLTDEHATLQGYEMAKVHRVVLTSQGSAVLLQSQDSGKILPIFVGGTEALSIDLRNDSKRFQRPLTHDLLDELVVRLGGKIRKVHALRGHTFIGRVFCQQHDQWFDVDARPSDAIALALGNNVPIYVSTRVFEQAGVSPNDISGTDPDELPSSPMGRPKDPMQL